MKGERERGGRKEGERKEGLYLDSMHSLIPASL
jgi:hypothetical protein